VRKERTDLKLYDCAVQRRSVSGGVPNPILLLQLPTEPRLQGVAAINRNNRQEARQYFQQAYALDQNNAFSLNNLGYVAELEGDSETAQAQRCCLRRIAAIETIAARSSFPDG
jgi:tetratricopeptide (TPR) repeat protein